MSDQPAEPDTLTDEQISPDNSSALADPDEATDPDVRNTAQGQDDGQDPVDQADPQREMADQGEEEPQSGPRTSPTD